MIIRRGRDGTRLKNPVVWPALSHLTVENSGGRTLRPCPRRPVGVEAALNEGWSRLIRVGGLAVILSLAIPGFAQFPGVSLTPGNILAVSGDVVREYTPLGVEVQSIGIPYPEAPGLTEFLRDIVVIREGNIEGFNGTFRPFLSTVAPDSGTRAQPQCSGWSTVNRPTYGGIATWQNYVYVSDMRTLNTPEAGAAGLVRFDTRDFSCQRSADTAELVDVAVGLDGLVYGLTKLQLVKVHDPETLALIRNVPLRTGDYRAIAVNRAGDIFSAAGNGVIYRLDGNDGTSTLNSLSVAGTLGDIDLSSTGGIVLASVEGMVIVTDEGLAEASAFEGGNFVAWVPPFSRSEVQFSVPDRGGASVHVTAEPEAKGYARIDPLPFSTTPAGLAILGSRLGSVLVSESAFSAISLSTSGRAFAEMGAGIRTGVAIANPDAVAASLTFEFTDPTGVRFSGGVLDVPPGARLVRFFDDRPFEIASPLLGTFTFNSSVPVAVAGLRELLNERRERLTTSLPVAPITATGFPGVRVGETQYLPLFAAGGGWISELVIVNPSDQTIDGSVRIRGQDTAFDPLSVVVNGKGAETFAYSIPPRSSTRMRVEAFEPGVVVGSLEVAPSLNQGSPFAFVIVRYRSGPFTVSEAALTASSLGRGFRMYAEITGNARGSTRSGIAVANPSSNPVSLTFDLHTLEGIRLDATGTQTIPALGQMTMFVDQIPGFESIAKPFLGVLGVQTSADESVAVTGLRGRLNERGDFLIAATAPTLAQTVPSTTGITFPYVVVGESDSAQFVFFAGSAGQITRGELRFLSETGQKLTLTLP